MKIAPTSSLHGHLSRLVAFLAFVSLLLCCVGCGNTLYLVEVRRAEKHFEEARELGAEEYAPYEYYSAKVRIEEAKRQAAVAEYGPAAELSDQADEYALQAIEKTKLSRSRSASPSAGDPKSAAAAPEARP